MSKSHPSTTSRTRVEVLDRRAREAYRNVADVAVLVIEESRDVMELDYAVRQWRMARTDFERAQRDLPASS